MWFVCMVCLHGFIAETKRESSHVSTAAAKFTFQKWTVSQKSPYFTLELKTLKDMDYVRHAVSNSYFLLNKPFQNSRVPQRCFAVKVQCLVRKKKHILPLWYGHDCNIAESHITTHHLHFSIYPPADSWKWFLSIRSVLMRAWKSHSTFPFSLFHFLSFSRIFLYLF